MLHSWGHIRLLFLLALMQAAAMIVLARTSFKGKSNLHNLQCNQSHTNKYISFNEFVLLKKKLKMPKENHKITKGTHEHVCITSGIPNSYCWCRNFSAFFMNTKISTLTVINIDNNLFSFKIVTLILALERLLN